jgi:vibriolysin
MMSRRTTVRGALVFAASLIGCHSPDVGEIEPHPDSDTTGIPADVSDALAQLPDAQVLESTDDGIPTFIIGTLAQVGQFQNDNADAASAAIMPMLPKVLAPMRLTTGDLALRLMNVDDSGGRHFRYRQVHSGLEVVGGDLVVHVDVKGAVIGVNGTARGDIADSLGANPVSQSTAVASISSDLRWRGMSVSPMREVYLQTADGKLFKAYEATVSGANALGPVRDKVYTNVETGQVLEVHPQVYFAENRKVYTTNHSTTLPGTLVRSEGGAASSDLDVNGAYDGTGDAYEGYKNFWNRDSYDNAGGVLTSTVHYSSNYCNAFWNGTQMAYGDGNSSQGCAPLARSIDVTAHELTHAVTERESGLVYSGESGGMNEAMSDIFGSFIEAFVNGGKTGTLTIDSGTFLVGEDVIPPFLRNQCDPAADGSSADFWSSTVGNLDVHYSSGVGNLAFCLLSQGGHHPRNKTTFNVTGVGLATAIRIMYEAQTNILTSNAKYANVRTAMEQAATNLGLSQSIKDSVSCAWAAVNVGTPPTSCGGSTPPPPPPGDIVLSNGVPVGNLSGATGSQTFASINVPAGQTTLTVNISGGSGDADLYVRFGSKPTLTSYNCRPYLNGNSETCTFNAPAAGTWFVMLNGYAAFSGVTLKATYSATTGGDPYIQNGVAVTNLSGASGSQQYFRIAVTAGRTLTVKISGGTGDADLYTRFGARPTTSTFNCRPYLNGNNETCTITNTSAGDYYIMLRGFTSYSGVTLLGSF